MSKIQRAIVSHVKINRMCYDIIYDGHLCDLVKSEIYVEEANMACVLLGRGLAFSFLFFFYSILYVLLEMVRCSSTDFVTADVVRWEEKELWVCWDEYFCCWLCLNTDCL